eukprot:m.142736 g.142736  ORF g.142736 m.142736 type:complete len:120 (+) comp16002_c3_seq1:60-419(+)
MMKAFALALLAAVAVSTALSAQSTTSPLDGLPTEPAITTKNGDLYLEAPVNCWRRPKAQACLPTKISTATLSLPSLTSLLPSFPSALIVSHSLAHLPCPECCTIRFALVNPYRAASALA